MKQTAAKKHTGNGNIAPNSSGNGSSTEPIRNMPILPKAVLQHIADDIAAAEGIPETNGIVPEAYLPADRQARQLIGRYLYPQAFMDSSISGIKIVLYAAFRQASASIEGHSLSGDVKALIRFLCIHTASLPLIPFSPENFLTFHAFFSNMEVALGCAKESFSFMHLSYMEEALSGAKKNPSEMDCGLFYQMTLTDWETLKDMPCTYSALSSLILLQTGWKETPQMRYAIIRMLGEIRF